jgi:hypothetical protein
LETSHSPSGVRRDDRSQQYRPCPLPARTAGPGQPGSAPADAQDLHQHADERRGDAVCDAEYGARSAERVNTRNGYQSRQFDTRAGTLDVAIPKLRTGSYFPDWLLERRRRAERALTTVVATCYLLG